MATVTQPTLETAVFSEDNVEAGKAVFKLTVFLVTVKAEKEESDLT
jgi:hypothetical protein